MVSSPRSFIFQIILQIDWLQNFLTILLSLVLEFLGTRLNFDLQNFVIEIILCLIWSSRLILLVGISSHIFCFKEKLQLNYQIMSVYFIDFGSYRYFMFYRLLLNFCTLYCYSILWINTFNLLNMCCFWCRYIQKFLWNIIWISKQLNICKNLW